MPPDEPNGEWVRKIIAFKKKSRPDRPYFHLIPRGLHQHRIARSDAFVQLAPPQLAQRVPKGVHFVCGFVFQMFFRRRKKQLKSSCPLYEREKSERKSDKILVVGIFVVGCLSRRGGTLSTCDLRLHHELCTPEHWSVCGTSCGRIEACRRPKGRRCGGQAPGVGGHLQRVRDGGGSQGRQCGEEANLFFDVDGWWELEQCVGGDDGPHGGG